MVFNNTKVIPARLFATKLTGGNVEILVERILENNNTQARDRVLEIIKRLNDRDFSDNLICLNDEKTPSYHFSDEAQQLFNEWLAELEQKVRKEELPIMQEHLAL